MQTEIRPVCRTAPFGRLRGMKPLINLDELELITEENGPFAERYGVISDRIGAKKLGYSLTILSPGKRACPFHNHLVVIFAVAKW